MKLEVLPTEDKTRPWYSRGLKFTCTQCGNCCTGPAGYVWISDEEIARLAGHLKMTAAEVQAKYCRTVFGRISLKETRTPEGNYDCIFLQEKSAEIHFDGTPPARHKACSIYSVRPLQCRTWPFWPENLSSRQRWKGAGKRCHGMDAGHRHFSLKQIETLRDAQDWPNNPPTSAGKKD
ncbi:MAG TPA: YkgJ family cysteine cluster protein [Tepidisphaeraceae bacterium]|jgi:hypothetical protein|nr:YkgJ family cysteine cluster protein [Tepidisphaeraceae bacterium]